jgi:hypothetical protein
MITEAVSSRTGRLVALYSEESDKAKIREQYIVRSFAGRTLDGRNGLYVDRKEA